MNRSRDRVWPVAKGQRYVTLAPIPVLCRWWYRADAAQDLYEDRCDAVLPELREFTVVEVLDDPPGAALCYPDHARALLDELVPPSRRRPLPVQTDPSPLSLEIAATDLSARCRRLAGAGVRPTVRWQASLGTCVAAMFVVAVLLGLSLVEHTESAGEVAVLDVRGFPFACQSGKPRVPGYEGTIEDWAEGFDPPEIDGERTLRRLGTRNFANSFFDRPRQVERSLAYERYYGIRAFWRLPANIAINLGLLAAIVYGAEYRRRRLDLLRAGPFDGGKLQ